MASNILKRDPRKESDWEVVEAQRLLKENPLKLQSFWNERYDSTYAEVLEGVPEFGRHGVIAEYIVRFIKTGTILDAGCGTGILSELIDTKHYRYEGIDISSLALEIAVKKRKRDSVSFTLSSFESFEPDKEYDVIVFNEILYYLNFEQTIKKCYQILKGNGLIIVSIFHFKRGLSLIQKIKKELSIISETNIETPQKNLKWHIVSGHLK